MNPVFEFLLSTYEQLRERPFVLLLLISVPLVFLGALRRIYPHKLFVLLLVLPCLFTAALIVKQDVFPLVLTLDAAIACVAAWDIISMPGRDLFSVGE